MLFLIAAGVEAVPAGNRPGGLFPEFELGVSCPDQISGGDREKLVRYSRNEFARKLETPDKPVDSGAIAFGAFPILSFGGHGLIPLSGSFVRLRGSLPGESTVRLACR